MILRTLPGAARPSPRLCPCRLAFQVRSRAGRAAGVSLVEVLIAIVVLSVGMLGTLGTMNGSIRLSWSAGARGQAAIGLESIAEALRANPSALLALTGATGTTTGASTGTTTTSGPADACFSSSTSGCTPAAASQTIVALWQQSLADTLAKGRGTICRDSAPGSHAPALSGTAINWNCDGKEPFVAKVCWDETRLGGRDDTASADNATGFQSVRTAGTGTAGGNANVLMCTWTAI